jgi:hypothetical protein
VLEAGKITVKIWLELVFGSVLYIFFDYYTECGFATTSIKPVPLLEFFRDKR